MENRTDQKHCQTSASDLNRICQLVLLLTLFVTLVGCPAKKESKPGAGSVRLQGSTNGSYQCQGGLNITSPVLPNLYKLSWTGPDSGYRTWPFLGQSTPLSDFELVDNLTPGNYDFSITWTINCGPGGATSQVASYNANVTVSVISGQTVTAPYVIDLAKSTHNSTLGSIAFTWTIGGLPAASACPPNTMVTLQDIPHLMTQSVACTSETVTISNIPTTSPSGDSHTFTAILSNGTVTAPDNLNPFAVENIPVTVNPASMTPVFLDFPALGALNIIWTVNGNLYPTGYSETPVGITMIPDTVLTHCSNIPPTGHSGPVLVRNITPGPHDFTASIQNKDCSTPMGLSENFTAMIEAFKVTDVKIDFFSTSGLLLGWTVASSPTPTACPIGAMVSIISTAQPGTSVSAGPAPCTSSYLWVPLSDPGDYTFQTTLSSGTGTSVIGGILASVPTTTKKATKQTIDFVLQILPAPTNPFAQPADNAVFLAWNAVTGAASYNIYWATTTGVTPSNGTKINTTSIPYYHNSLNPAFTYYYVITAVDAGGVEGPPSTEVSAKPIGIPLPI